MTKTRLATAIAALTFSALANAQTPPAPTNPSGQIDTNRVVVVVNGEEVKANEYYRRMEFLPGVGKTMGRTFNEFPPGFLTIEQLITEHLVFQLAKDKGVLPTDLEIDAELKARQADSPQLLQNWLAAGRTLDEFKYQIKYDLAQFKIQTFGVTITNQQIDKHYADNPSTFSLPKRAKLRVIVVQSEDDQKKVDADLAAKKPFADVAKQYSADVSKIQGGEYGTVPYAFLNTPVRDAVNATKIGQTTIWITTKEDEKPTYLKFLLEDILPEEKIPLTDQLRRNIRRKLMLDAGSVKNNIQKEMMDVRTRAKIDIKQAEFADAYRKFIEAYLKQGD